MKDPSIFIIYEQHKTFSEIKIHICKMILKRNRVKKVKGGFIIDTYS
jgi:hypothetical protein